MGIIAGMRFLFAGDNDYHADKRADFIFYKIVDFIREGHYLLQCINTKATFQLDISEIVLDADVLHGLHPIQACYIGIEYSQCFKSLSASEKIKKHSRESLDKRSIHRYGRYQLFYQDRQGNICFINQKNENFWMDPRDIALSKECIQEFDAAQAFYIGLLAGFKLNAPEKKMVEPSALSRKPHLKIVK